MESLSRSEISFRRQGSSGLVWDDKFLSGELKKISTKDNEDQQSVADKPKSEAKHATVDQTRERHQSAYRTANITPAEDPPSPKVSGCGICGAFGKPGNSKKSRKRSAAHRKAAKS